MLRFNEEQVTKYTQNIIGGTGFLAFRDIEQFAKKHKTDLSYVLDLGCGSGRSTNFLNHFCQQVTGCDIDQKALDNAIKNSTPKDQVYFQNTSEQKIYQYSPYSSIFSILMFFHLSSKEEIKQELIKCHNSLKNDGNLIIINGSRNLYIRNYLTVKGVGKPPDADGDSTQIQLVHIDCTIEDFYWSNDCIVAIAQETGFVHLDTYFPLGKKEDQIKYLDEIKYPPYYYIALRKN